MGLACDAGNCWIRSWGLFATGADGGDGRRGVGVLEGCDFAGIGVVESEFDDFGFFREFVVGGVEGCE